MQAASGRNAARARFHVASFSVISDLVNILSFFNILWFYRVNFRFQMAVFCFSRTFPSYQGSALPPELHQRIDDFDCLWRPASAGVFTPCRRYICRFSFSSPPKTACPAVGNAAHSLEIISQTHYYPVGKIKKYTAESNRRVR